VKLSTDLQILGCELHKNAFVGQAPPGTAEGSYSAPPDLLAVIRGVCPMLEGTHKVSSWDQPLMRRGREGWEVGERVRKGKGYFSRGPRIPSYATVQRQ